MTNKEAAQIIRTSVLYEECELTYHCEKDKKGNVKRIIIETK